MAKKVVKRTNVMKPQSHMEKFIATHGKQLEIILTDRETRKAVKDKAIAQAIEVFSNDHMGSMSLGEYKQLASDAKGYCAKLANKPTLDAIKCYFNHKASGDVLRIGLYQYGKMNNLDLPTDRAFIEGVVAMLQNVLDNTESIDVLTWDAVKRIQIPVDRTITLD